MNMQVFSRGIFFHLEDIENILIVGQRCGRIMALDGVTQSSKCARILARPSTLIGPSCLLVGGISDVDRSQQATYAASCA